MTVQKAISKIDRKGALLVYPLQNRPEPASLWSEFFPRSKMRWEWDSGGDNRVARLWHLREQVSCSGKAIYAKWYQGRATFFSRRLFPQLVAGLGFRQRELSQSANTLLRILEEDSPLSTRELKKRASMTGGGFESTYEKALKELWKALLIVGYGEVADGAFPSLALGAASLLFDDLWAQAQALDQQEAEEAVARVLGRESAFFRYYLKTKAVPARRLPRVVRYEDLA